MELDDRWLKVRVHRILAAFAHKKRKTARRPKGVLAEVLRLFLTSDEACLHHFTP